MALQGTSSVVIHPDFVGVINEQIQLDKDFICPLPEGDKLQSFYEEKLAKFYNSNLQRRKYALPPPEKNKLIENFKKELQSEACKKDLLQKLGTDYFIQPIPTSKQTPVLVWETFVKSPLPQQVPHMNLTARVAGLNISMFAYMVSLSNEKKGYEALKVVFENMTPAQWVKMDLNEKIGEETVLTKLLYMPYYVVEARGRKYLLKNGYHYVFSLQLELLKLVFRNLSQTQWAQLNFNPSPVREKVDPLWFLIYYFHTRCMYPGEGYIDCLLEFVNKAPSFVWQKLDLTWNGPVELELAETESASEESTETEYQYELWTAENSFEELTTLLYDNELSQDNFITILNKISKKQFAQLKYDWRIVDSLKYFLDNDNDTTLRDLLMRRGNAKQIANLSLKTFERLKKDEILAMLGPWRNLYNFCVNLNNNLSAKSSQVEIQALFNEAQECAEDGFNTRAYLLLGDVLQELGDFENAALAYQAYVDYTSESHSDINFNLASMYFSGNGMPENASKRASLLKAYHYVCKMDVKDPARTELRNNILANFFYGFDSITDEFKGTPPYDHEKHPLVAVFNEMAEKEGGELLMFQAQMKPAVAAIPAAAIPAAATPITPARDLGRKRREPSRTSKSRIEKLVKLNPTL